MNPLATNPPCARLGCLGLVCALGLPLPSLAFAADSPSGPAPLAESLSGAAKDAYISAQILVNNGDFAGAQKKYSQAYDLSKDARLLFNMAVCARNLRAYARMQTLLTRYRHEAGAALTPEDTADVDSALAAIRNLVGTVRLTTVEAGADVTVDEQSVGTTPLASPLVVDLGTHRLSVTKEGFKPVEQAIDVLGGAEAAVAIALVPVRHVARLIVASDEDSIVSIDDKLPAKGRFDAQLEAGRHEVRVTEPGKIAYRAQVDLKDGEMRTLQISLEGQRHGAAWPWIAGGAALVAGAVVAGYFVFRTSPEAPAPLTGTFATVQLSSAGRR